MRAVIQRVKQAQVVVDGKPVSSIQQGLLTLLGVEKNDSEDQVEKIVAKICELRIFEDEDCKMNRSLKDIHGEHLIVSQFTLVGDCAKGRRPSFINAEEPQRANKLYELAISKSASHGVTTKGGAFQKDMQVSLINDGPVTFVIDC